MKPKSVQIEDVIAWWRSQGFHDLTHPIGAKRIDSEYLDSLGIPVHIQFLIEQLAAERNGHAEDILASISFYSLCRGLFLPLSGLQPPAAARLFGLQVDPPPCADERDELLVQFLNKPIGLSPPEKLACLTCDPFQGRASRFRQDRMLRLISTFHLVGRKTLLDRLVQFGDVASLFAASRTSVKSDPPLTAAEVLQTLRLLHGKPQNRTFEVLRSIIARCGRVEAYFLARLLLGRNGPGLGVSTQAMCRALAEVFLIDSEPVVQATALTDIFHVAEVLSEKGVEGLRAIQLQPLSPVRPALAGGTTDQLRKFPVWVERKYDGVRFLLHKSTDARGGMLCGAYTRNGNDWLELVPGLDATIRMFPARSMIVDGELCGTRLDGEILRPATVYEVMAVLKGDPMPLSLRFSAFDILYLNGFDQTRRPLRERQMILSNLLAALVGLPLPVPVSMAEGHLANSMADVNRLYHHFLAQGYEGIIAKDLSAPYAIAARDPTWLKRKAEATLDLVILGATFAVGNRHPGAFGSYVIGARDADGFVDIGDVDGLGRELDLEIQRLIRRDGLMTGRRIERKLTDGTRAGLELRPSIVVSVLFQEISREPDGRLTLRHPRIKLIRADKSAEEADTVQGIVEVFERQRAGEHLQRAMRSNSSGVGKSSTQYRAG